jgi:hypothetical protein
MKIIAILLNVGSLGTLLFLVSRGRPTNISDYFFLSAFILTPIINLTYILLTSKESWLGLYFERRRREEKIKIERLQRLGSEDRSP